MHQDDDDEGERPRFDRLRGERKVFTQRLFRPYPADLHLVEGTALSTVVTPMERPGTSTVTAVTETKAFESCVPKLPTVVPCVIARTGPEDAVSPQIVIARSDQSVREYDDTSDSSDSVLITLVSHPDDRHAVITVSSDSEIEPDESDSHSEEDQSQLGSEQEPELGDCILAIDAQESTLTPDAPD